MKISVNAAILSDSGGTCVCPTADLCVADPVYLACATEVKRDLVTTTAAIAALASFLMGLFANLPVGMAPGLGLNAYVGAIAYMHPRYAILTNHYSSRTQSSDSTDQAISLIGKLSLLYSWKDGFSSSFPSSVSVNGSQELCHNHLFSLLVLVSVFSLRKLFCHHTFGAPADERRCSFIGLGPSGLGVVGGNTATFVGLGGCLETSELFRMANKYRILIYL